VLVREPDYDDAETLTPAQVAELFDMTPRTIRRWVDAGVLPSFRTVGGQRRSGGKRFDTRATDGRRARP
jgi:excisionase family DNA binding protein